MPKQQAEPAKTLDQIAEQVGEYPLEAYQFVREGLNEALKKIHAGRKLKGRDRHISGQQLCEGLRDFALQRWGRLSRTVLARWNLTTTEDFGKIVFTLVDAGWLSKTDDDSLEDFKKVYSFKTAFEQDYRIGSFPEAPPPARQKR